MINLLLMGKEISSSVCFFDLKLLQFSHVDLGTLDFESRYFFDLHAVGVIVFQSLAFAYQFNMVLNDNSSLVN